MWVSECVCLRFSTHRAWNYPAWLRCKWKQTNHINHAVCNHCNVITSYSNLTLLITIVVLLSLSLSLSLWHDGMYAGKHAFIYTFFSFNLEKCTSTKCFGTWIKNQDEYAIQFLVTFNAVWTEVCTVVFPSYQFFLDKIISFCWVLNIFCSVSNKKPEKKILLQLILAGYPHHWMYSITCRVSQVCRHFKPSVVSSFGCTSAKVTSWDPNSNVVPSNFSSVLLFLSTW